jgi:hypothetical protein
LELVVLLLQEEQVEQEMMRAGKQVNQEHLEEVVVVTEMVPIVQQEVVFLDKEIQVELEREVIVLQVEVEELVQVEQREMEDQLDQVEMDQRLL